LPLVNAVTAYDHPTAGCILFGLGSAAYDDRKEQTEALINSHVMREANVIVDDKTERDGGLQQFEVDGITVKLDFIDKRTLSFKNRMPTEEELENNEVHWLTPRVPDSQSGPYKNKSPVRRHPASLAPEKGSDWSERLGDAPEMIVAKTLETTTQLCASPVEMDNREAPRQHRKQRVLPLHPKRLEGRTDSDTFFSSIISIRNFACVQIFVHLVSRFIYVQCMRKESESHGAYQDFIREVGAPNVLLTDNAQTEVGKLWTKTSRDNATKRIYSVPHNQNQNQAERKIHDVKKRTIKTLRLARAPLEFWCYCMKYMVDCLNHTSHKTIGYRVPMERLYGMTPDISMFRFSFYEPVW
jgi:hypothetical protein